MRLTSVEKPGTLFLKIAYYLSRRRFGKPLAALRIIYARFPPALKVALRILRTEKQLVLPRRLQLFIRYYTSHLNDCPFCSNAIDYAVARENEAFQEWKEFLDFRNSSRFSEKEKALLTYLEEVNFSKTATEETFSALKRHFSEREIVELTWINATENYFNLMAKPLGLSSDQLQFGG
ncbi:hypothetical protein [Compostibacter hankyongensis]|uniref:Carboxymuconolactone decarboxylase family protein n=1 Tax=Compostibacter hankyongensis TaxID=1007089 RepID=A0ABP8G064_9BACT